MIRSFIILCSFVMLTACNPTDDKDSSPLTNASATATHGDDKADARLKSEVESLVRRFSDDPSARVSIGEIDGEIVCGVMTSRGKKVDFYVDLVDEEAMFANGPMKAAVSAAC